VGIAFCIISTLILLLISFLVVPEYSSIGENSRRPVGFLLDFLGKFMNTDYIAVHTSLIMAVVFSLAGILMIFFFFEQTSAPEILYIAFFTISFSFETIRLILPLSFIYDIPPFYLNIASRLLLFARYFGLFSLFAASLCAAGLEIQMTRNAIMILLVCTLIVTLGIPIDSFSWDTGFNMIFGFSTLLKWINIAAFFSIVTSFFIAAYVRGSREYVYIGIGVIFALAGKYLLLHFDIWAGVIPGILLLSFGTWFICSKLHKIYLWL
jgi:hypothetical protein